MRAYQSPGGRRAHRASVAVAARQDRPKGILEGWGLIVLLSIALLFVPAVGGWLALATLWCWAALCGKRLHDLAVTAWAQLAPLALAAISVLCGIAITAVGVAASARLGNIFTHQTAETGVKGVLLLVVGVGPAVWLIFTLWLGLAKGQPDDNRHGPAPQGRTAKA